MPPQPHALSTYALSPHQRLATATALAVLGVLAVKGAVGAADPAPPRPQVAASGSAAALAAVPAALADVVVLAQGVSANADSVMIRYEDELARQAVWLAATHEVGLRVRDASLGEPEPAGLPSDRRLRLDRPDARSHSAVALRSGPAGAGRDVWTGRTDDPKRFHVIDRVPGWEAASRDELPRALAAAGFPAKPVPRSDAPVPPAAEELLGQMREFSQFAAVRMLHAEVRAKGESDALLGALARGYANLGLLTDYQWGPAPAVFQARGVLYAQRLAARTKNAPAALWLRAYALALAGVHSAALDDVAAARKAGAEVPAWAEALDAYVNFDTARLAKARATADTPLVRLLQYLTVEEPLVPHATLTAARAYLADNPECYRVREGVCRVDGLSHLHAETTAWPAVLDRKLPRRVREQPGLPKSVLAVLDADEGTEAEMYAALRAAADPAADRGEPSWAALATVAQGARFAQVWCRLYFMASTWSVPTTEEATAAVALLAGHPLVPLVEAFTIDPARDPAGRLKKLTDPAGDRLGVRASSVHQLLKAYGQEPAMAWLRRVSTQYEGTYQAEAMWNRLYRLEGSFTLPTKSPRSPWRAVVEASGQRTPPGRLAELEAANAGWPIVQEALARQHDKAGRAADAARCWARRLELSPDAYAYLTAAAAYKKEGKDDLYLKTLTDSLAAEDSGLGHARARVDIAKHYLARNQPEKAEPYALEAAETHAGWALLCAADCEEKLEKWDEANALLRALSERYDDQVFIWYFACRRLGKMDRDAAEDLVTKYLAGFPAGIPVGLAFNVGRFHLLAGRPKKALEEFDRAAANAPAVPMFGLFAALVADDLGDAAGRDARLARAAGGKPGGDAEYLRAAAAALAGWAAKGTVPDAAAVDAAVKGLPPGQRADVMLFFGWYASNRKQPARAAELWAQCVKEDTGVRLLKTHAGAFLQVRKPPRK